MSLLVRPRRDASVDEDRCSRRRRQRRRVRRHADARRRIGRRRRTLQNLGPESAPGKPSGKM